MTRLVPMLSNDRRFHGSSRICYSRPGTTTADHQLPYNFISYLRRRLNELTAFHYFLPLLNPKRSGNFVFLSGVKA